MTWEQHRYAVERARDRLRKTDTEINEANQMVTLQGEAASSDAEMLDEVAEYLARHEPPVTHSPAYDNDLERQRRFVYEWDKMIRTVSLFAFLQDLPAPDLIFHPKWHVRMNQYSPTGQHIQGTLIYAGVRARFGTWEQANVLRQS